MIIKRDPVRQLIKQINSFYGIDHEEELIIQSVNAAVLDDMALCFSHIKNKYYYLNENAVFNPLHLSQWTQYLYRMANIIKKANFANTDLCDKIYGLSKAFSSADLFYEVELPKIWFSDHPQGSVIGKAEYSNFFTFSQGCTVGNNKGIFPKFKEHVSMFSNSKVLGNCSVGNHVIFSANSFVMDTDIPSYSIVFGTHPNITIHPITNETFEKLTGSMFNAEDIVG